MDGEPVKVFANVTLDRFRVDNSLENAITKIADNSSRAVSLAERLERPVQLLLLMSGVSVLAWSLGSLATALMPYFGSQPKANDEKSAK